MNFKTCVSLREMIFSFFFISISSVSAQSNNYKIQPNVIVIIADDMGVGDIAVNNGGLNRTPNLDKLIKESVWFNQAYSASAVCAPARASLLTGRYPHRTGVVGLDMENYPAMTSLGKNETTLADIFSSNAYHTGLIGKWHLGNRPEYHPMKRGFNDYVGFMGAFDIDTYFKFKLDINGSYKKYNGEYLTDVLTDSAVSFVNKYKKEPFFLHLAYYAPHRPLGAPQELVEYYKSKGFDTKTAQVYAMIEVMDTGIGKLLKGLDLLKIRENTIIVFASDNGPDPVVGKRFNQEMKGSKYMVYEGGIRVPLIFNWQGKLKRAKAENLFHFVDIFPTLMGLCNIEISKAISEKLDGVDISKQLVKTKESDSQKTRYWQWNRGNPYYSHNAAVREGDWKLIYPPLTNDSVNDDSKLMPKLFNIKKDPTESNDVSLHHKKIYNRLKILLEDWSRKMERSRLETTSFDN